MAKFYNYNWKEEMQEHAKHIAPMNVIYFLSSICLYPILKARRETGQSK